MKLIKVKKIIHKIRIYLGALFWTTKEEFWTDEEIDFWAEHMKREEIRKVEIAEMIVKVRNENMKAFEWIKRIS